MRAWLPFLWLLLLLRAQSSTSSQQLAQPSSLTGPANYEIRINRRIGNAISELRNRGSSAKRELASSANVQAGPEEDENFIHPDPVKVRADYALGDRWPGGEAAHMHAGRSCPPHSTQALRTPSTCERHPSTHQLSHARTTNALPANQWDQHTGSWLLPSLLIARNLLQFNPDPREAPWDDQTARLQPHEVDPLKPQDLNTKSVSLG